MVCLGILTFELQFYNWSDRSYIHQSSYFYQPEKKSYLNEPKVFKKKKFIQEVVLIMLSGLLVNYNFMDFDAYKALCPFLACTWGKPWDFPVNPTGLSPVCI